MILRPAEPRIQVKQVILDECEEEPYSRLKEGGKYVDELVILPDESVIIVEYAKWPKARDGKQALESLRKLLEMGMKAIAVVIIGKKGFDKRDKGLIAQALRSECSKHGVEIFLKRPGQVFTVKSIKFNVTN